MLYLNEKTVENIFTYVTKTKTIRIREILLLNTKREWKLLELEMREVLYLEQETKTS